MHDKYIKTVISYSRKFPSSSDDLIVKMVNKQFSEHELNQLWKKEQDGKSQ